MAEEKTEKEGVKEEATKEKSEKTEKEEVEVPEKFKELVEKIEKMTVLDLAELVKVLEKKFGVSAAPQVVAAPTAASAGQGEGGGAPKEEKSVFNVVLTGIGDKKIEVIKVVRDITGKGLKDSKDIVDAVSSGPQVIKENVKKEEAEEMKKKFESAGAKVELK
ncbi:MAG: 50S ribosomal protein L7/L12 [Candidatus Aminicenantes bacterium]|nr:MAG: 50S ribosomal protein L7/L12 [Candidatus Aminicenantes bacterium]